MAVDMFMKIDDLKGEAKDGATKIVYRVRIRG